jgi:putative transcriptional regulator
MGNLNMVNIESRFIIKNKIKVLREETKMTQQALADAVGVTRATINAMEKGAYNPSLELAFRLARFFKVDIQTIFFVED